MTQARMTERARLAAARLTSGRPALRQTPTSRARFQGMCAANTNAASQAGAPAANEHQGEQCSEQADDGPAENAPEPEGATKWQATTPELDYCQYLRLPPVPRTKNTAQVLAWSQKTQRSSSMARSTPPPAAVMITANLPFTASLSK
jgi:hypothetical protein